MFVPRPSVISHSLVQVRALCSISAATPCGLYLAGHRPNIRCMSGARGLCKPILLLAAPNTNNEIHRSVLSFGKYSVRVSTAKPVILIETLRGFSQSLQENFGILPRLGHD
jgi:hypothetical protein